MGYISEFTTQTRLKTVPSFKDNRQADFKLVRAAQKRADLEWQMNLANLKLRELKGDKIASRNALQLFHDAALSP